MWQSVFETVISQMQVWSVFLLRHFFQQFTVNYVNPLSFITTMAMNISCVDSLSWDQINFAEIPLLHTKKRADSFKGCYEF